MPGIMKFATLHFCSWFLCFWANHLTRKCHVTNHSSKKWHHDGTTSYEKRLCWRYFCINSSDAFLNAVEISRSWASESFGGALLKLVLKVAIRLFPLSNLMTAHPTSSVYHRRFLRACLQHDVPDIEKNKQFSLNGVIFV